MAVVSEIITLPNPHRIETAHPLSASKRPWFMA